MMSLLSDVEDLVDDERWSNFFTREIRSRDIIVRIVRIRIFNRVTIFGSMFFLEGMISERGSKVDGHGVNSEQFH